MEIFGIDWVGINAENGRKLLLSIVFIIVVLLVSWVLRGTVGLVLGKADRASVQTRFRTRQAVSLLAAVVLIVGDEMSRYIIGELDRAGIGIASATYDIVGLPAGLSLQAGGAAPAGG